MGNVGLFAWINSPVTGITLKNCDIKDSKIKFEPFQVEGLKYPEVEVILDNTKISEDFITHTTDGITVK